jgi:hypothetical protein
LLVIKHGINKVAGMHKWWHHPRKAYLGMTLPRLIQTYLVNSKQYIKSSSLLNESSISKSFLHHGDSDFTAANLQQNQPTTPNDKF